MIQKKTDHDHHHSKRSDKNDDESGSYGDDGGSESSSFVTATKDGRISTTEDDTTERTPKKEILIAATETRKVRQVKFVIVLVVFMSVIGALIVFFYSKRLEHKQFEKTFYSDGKKVLESLGSSIERTLVGLDNLAITSTTVAHATNQTFPFVTIPGFEQHVANVDPIVGATCTHFAPLVRLEERLEWELFASGNNTALPRYVQEAMQFQEEYPFYYGPMPQNYSWNYHDSIFQDDYENPPFSDVPYYNTTRPDLLNIYFPSFLRFPLVLTACAPSNWGEFKR
jgi:hypothetical protein